VAVSSGGRLTAGESFSLRIEFTAETELRPGDAFVVVIPYPWPRPAYSAATEQRPGARFENSAPGFTSAWASNPKVRLTMFCDPVLDPSRLGEGWHLVTTIRDAPLARGEKLVLTYGDTTYGSAGAATHLATEFELVSMVYRQIDWAVLKKSHQAKRPMTVYSRTAEYGMLENCPRLMVHGGRASEYRVFAPSEAAVDAAFTVQVVARDRFGNPAESCAGEARFQPLENAVLPKPLTLGRQGPCMERFTARLRQPGTYRLRLESAGGGISGTSNPILAAARLPAKRIWWGDLHVHTVESDGLGTVSSAFEFGRDAAGLDFASVTDHLNGVTQVIRENAEAYHEPGRFVTFNAFEFSGIPEGGGDLIVYAKSPSLEYEQMLPGDRATRPNIDKVAEIVGRLNRRNLIIVPHNHGGHYNVYRKGFDNETVRLMEIYSVWGNSEMSTPPYRPYYFNQQPRSVQQALALGYKVGIIASGDDHSGRPGGGSWLRVRRSHPSGLVAAYAASLTREDLWDALWNRRVYGTTGARIVLDFSVSGHAMGSIVQGAGKAPRRIQVKVVGTGKLKEIDIIRNNEVIHSHAGAGTDATFEYVDQAPPRAKDYYYLRVVQEDTEMAWSSPVWLFE
jgi:hypothetical protein